MFGNVGLAYRQRAQLVPWLLIFAMVGLEQRALRRLAARRAAIEPISTGRWPADSDRRPIPYRPAPGSNPTISKS